MKKKPHLKFYKQCLRNGIMPDAGLCMCTGDISRGLISSELLELFEPTRIDDIQLLQEHKSRGYWASDVNFTDKKNCYHFGTLRQTIVLFMAAMNGEL